MQNEDSLNAQAFLSSNILVYQANMMIKYKEYFDFIHDLNQLAQEHKSKYACDSRDWPKIISNNIFLKILNGFQAGIILLKHGLPFEATAISRTLCEPFYLIKCILDDPDFWKSCIKHDKCSVLKNINAFRINPNPMLDWSRESDYDKMIEEIKIDIDRFDDKQFNVERLAFKAGMHDHYDTMFRISSAEIHTTIQVINRYTKFNKDEAVSFNWGPTDEGCAGVIISVSNILIKSIILMDSMHSCSHHVDFEKIKSGWKVLDGKTQ